MTESTNWLAPVTLRDSAVTLEPLSRDHVEGLQRAVADGELWRLWYTSAPRPEATAAYVETALAAQASGTALPFVVRDRDGEIVGTTRYYDITPAHRRLSIGYTWYAARVQRSALNTQAKQLLLGHAFEHGRAIAVEFQTHWLNHRSRAAIARLGAKQDGVLRNHMLMADGSYRDTVVFSIIESEWPSVRRHLRHLRAPWEQPQ